MSDQPEAEKNFIPIDTIDGKDAASDEQSQTFVPKALADDPVSGDGSASREGVEVDSWRLRTLDSDRLRSVSEPDGSDRRSRNTRRVHDASRRARTKRGRTIRRRTRVIVALLMVAVVIGVAYAGITYAYEKWGGKKVPYVVGLSQANATAAMEEKGFKVTTETVASDAVDGHVVQVEPPEGNRIEEGSTIHLTVGKNRTIPEVVGKTREEARSALEAAGAQNIRFESRVSEDAQDHVLEIKPAAGALFLSSDEVTVYVSQLPHMIDVVGEEEAIALQHLEKEGIAAHSAFEQADASKRLKVVRTDPAAGEELGGKEATVFVGDPLSEVAHLNDYFDAKAPHIVEFLNSKGFEQRVGRELEGGRLAAGFVGDQNVAIGFLPDPWAHAFALDQGGLSDVMTEAAKIEGVRLVIPIPKAQQGAKGDTTVFGIKNPSVTETTARDVMKLCGFESSIDSCTQSDIKLPKGTNNTGHTFYCCYGETSNNAWTILIKGTSSGGKVVATEIDVSCVPKASYRSIDLEPFGNAICDFVAYVDEYQ